MRSLILLLLLTAFLRGQEESPAADTPIPALPVPESAEEIPAAPEVPAAPPVVERDTQGRIYIPSDPNPNREPAFDEIVPSKESEIDEDAPKVVPESLKTPPKDDGVRVSVLGYHEFSPSKPNTAMRIQSKKFRKQMEALRDLGKPIITMEDFHEVEERRRHPPAAVLPHHHR